MQLAPGTTATEDELKAHVAKKIGSLARPDDVIFSAELPKTRSAKIMRRVIRATYLGKEPGDLSSLENPGGVQAITEAV